MTDPTRYHAYMWERVYKSATAYRLLLLDPTAPIGKGARAEIKRLYRLDIATMVDLSHAYGVRRLP